MIDGQGQQAPPPPRAPVGRQMQQGHGVAAARQGQGDGAIRVRGQPRVQRGGDAVDQASHSA